MQGRGERHGHDVPFDIQAIPERLRPLGAEIESLWESALHCAHNQFSAAKIWRQTHRWLALIATVLGATVGVSAFAEVIGPRGAGAGSLLAAVIGGFNSLLNPEQHASACVASGNSYIKVRDRARQLLAVDLREIDYDVARAELETLTARLHEVNDAAEPPSGLARRNARRALRSGIANDGARVDRRRRSTSP